MASYSNYALRSLRLTAPKSPELVRIDEVAKIHGLSRPYIIKIVHELRKAGYLETICGRESGFRLARPSNEIIVGDIVRITEGSLEMVESFNSKMNTCPLMGICILSKKIQEATAAFMAVLDDLTIAHISANRGQLMGRIAPLEIPRTETASR